MTNLHMAPDFEASIDGNHRDLLNLIVGHAPDGLVLLDEQSVVRLINESALILLRKPAELLLTFPFPFELAGISPFELCLEEEGRDSRYVAVKRQEIVWNKLHHNILSLRDVTDRVRLREQLRSDSIHDALTKLYNRRGFMYFAQHHALVADREKRGMFVIIIDIDDMKSINDTLGHQAGDTAISQTARILRSTFRKSDVLARMGGDEFAVIAPGRNASDETAIRQRLNEALSNLNEKNGNSFRLSLSVGTSYYDPSYPCVMDDLLERADQSMYEEKRKNKQIVS